MLNKLTLQNFRSHANTTINFTPGLNVILGLNGSGKSSILQAIGIGLFGASPSLKEFVRYEQKSARIDIEFGEYLSVREIGKVSSWRLFKSGLPIADGEEAVTQEISKIFGLSDLRVLFNEMIGVRQFQMVAPFTQSSAPRQAYFNRLFGVDEYLKVSDNLRAGERYGEELLKEDEKELTKYNTIFTFYTDGQAEKVSLEKDIESLKKELAVLYQKQDDLQQLLHSQILQNCL